jgi:DnaJ-class molecular chaperone
MAQYLVIKRQKCKRCQGNGVTDHPAWNEYWRQHPEGLMNADQTYEWFVNRFSELLASNEAQLPPEEIPCADCRGNGEITEEIDLAVALRAIGAAS